MQAPATRRSASARLTDGLKLALLVAASVVLTVVVFEASVRLVLPARLYIWPPGLDRTFTPSTENMPGVSGPSRFRTSSRGLRAEEVDDSYTRRVLAVGGSTTECLYLDQTEAWPHVLQQQLNARDGTGKTWVGNAGMSGRNTRHHEMIMRYFPFEEMKVDTVLVLAGVNDLSQQLGQPGQGKAGADSSREDALLDETFTGMRHGHPTDPWFKRTFVWQSVRQLRDRLLRKPTTAAAQDDAGRIYETWRRHRAESLRKLDQMPHLDMALRSYADKLRTLVALGRQKAVRMIFLTQPALWKADLPAQQEALLWMGGVGDFQAQPGLPYYSAAALASGLARYNAAMLEVCRDEKVDCIDLSSLNGDASVFYDDVHFSEHGAREVARIAFEYLSRAAGPAGTPVRQ